MQALLYTDTDRIRAVLGVDEKDLSDEQITARDLEKELRIELLSWVSNYAALMVTGLGTAATEVQVSIADALSLYCTYYCSIRAIKTLQMAAPQRVSDGQNALDRFATIDWQGLTLDLKELAATYKKYVQDNTLTSTPKIYSALTGVGLQTDPVLQG